MKPRRLNLALTGLLLLLLSQSSLAQSEESDAPPPGTRSLFDYLFSEKNASGEFVYKVPDSFEGVMDRLRDFGAGEPLGLLVPLGRSLDRLGSSLSVPRLLTTFDGDPTRTYDGLVAPNVRGKIFIGLGQKFDQLEIISFNERAGRFEFQIVKNLSQKNKHEVLYVSRQFCGSCHKHRVPIFARNPWQETNSFAATSAAIEKVRGSDQPIKGIRIHETNSAAYRFDRTTDASADMFMFQKLWRDGCGGDGDLVPALGKKGAIECRKLLVKVALRKDFDFFIDTNSQDYERLAFLFTTFVKAKYGDEVAFPLADLRARDPLSKDEGIDPKALEQLKEVEINQEGLKMLKELAPIPPRFDPLVADYPPEDPYIHHPARKGVSQTSVYNYPQYSAELDRPKIRSTNDPLLLQETIDWVANELLIDFDFYESLIDENNAANMYTKVDQFLEGMADDAEKDGRRVLGNFTYVADEILEEFNTRNKGKNLKLCCGSDRGVPPVNLGEDTTVVEGHFTPDEKDFLDFTSEFCLPCHQRSVGSLGFFGEKGHNDFSSIDAEIAKKILYKVDWEHCKPPIGSPMPPAGHQRVEICKSIGKRKKLQQVLRDRFFPNDSLPICSNGEQFPVKKKDNWLCK
jgi:hypothetical protein